MADHSISDIVRRLRAHRGDLDQDELDQYVGELVALEDDLAELNSAAVVNERRVSSIEIDQAEETKSLKELDAFINVSELQAIEAKRRKVGQPGVNEDELLSLLRDNLARKTAKSRSLDEQRDLHLKVRATAYRKKNIYRELNRVLRAEVDYAQRQRQEEE